MSKAEYIFLMTLIGFYMMLCGALFWRAVVKSLGARWRVAPGRIEVAEISKAIDFTLSDRAWTRAVERDTLA